MNTVIKSARFIPRSRVPVRPTWISAGRAYEVLVGSEGSALLVEEDAVIPYYLTANFLDAAISITSDETGMQAATILPVAHYIFQFCQKNSSFRDRVDDLVSGPTVLQIEPMPLSFNQEEPNASDDAKVHMVHDSVGQLRGWYFSNKALVDITQTPPRPYVCQNDPKHYNPGPDHGQCLSCGGQLK